MNFDIKHSTEDQAFTVDINGEEGELAYSMPRDGVMDLTHTYVSQNLRNKGLASKLVEKAIDYAKEKNWKIIATCPYVKTFFQRHTQYGDLLEEENY